MLICMKLTIVENTPEAVKFRIDGVSYNFVNALRRIMMARVDAFAIDKVTFYENSASIFDEYIAHRIGQIPILTPKSYKAEDEVMLSLEAKGPGTVYSGDIKSSDKEIGVANEKIPVMKLADGQSLRLDAKATVGNGARSAKFQPGLAAYKNIGEGSFEFYVESFGQMPAIEIVRRALGIISNDIKSISKELK